ncbi:MAG TPA: c-type cytochrome, partial [Acidobacteriota bacterium]|nr:c-type cytochrome [Acidobacteriota bacterium]
GSASSLSLLVAGLWNHYPKMAQAMSAKGIQGKQITTTDMEDLMAYIYWARASGFSGNPLAGREVYQTKQCGACHEHDSKGLPAGPPLAGSEATRSPYTMLAAIWNHGPVMQKLLEKRNIAWPALTGEEMRDLIAFFRQPAPAH